MSDNVALPATGVNAAADEVTYSGDTTKVQLVRLVFVSGTEGAKSLSEISDATNGIDVDVTRLPSGTVAGSASLPAGTNNIGDVDVLSLPALPAGTNNIGDVDVLSIAAGTNTIGDVGIKPRTSGGLTTYHLISGASTNAVSVKASAGQLFGWYIYNSNAAARKVAFHNTAGTPTAGASVFFSIMVPPLSGANVFSETGIAFSTGIGITTTTGVADSDSASVAANDLNINLFYA